VGPAWWPALVDDVAARCSSTSTSCTARSRWWGS